MNNLLTNEIHLVYNGPNKYTLHNLNTYIIELYRYGYEHDLKYQQLKIRANIAQEIINEINLILKNCLTITTSNYSSKRIKHHELHKNNQLYDLNNFKTMVATYPSFNKINTFYQCLIQLANQHFYDFDE